MDKKKICEVQWAKEFLTDLDYIAREIQSFDPDPPDVVATIKPREADAWHRVGIEETSYYSGAAPGSKSQGQLLYDFWQSVRTSLARRIGHRPTLSNVAGNVWLDKEALIKTAKGINKKTQGEELARGIARELVCLSLEFQSHLGEEEISIRRQKMRSSTGFAIPQVYKLLNQYVNRVELRSDEYWQFNRNRFNADVNGAFVGISPKTLGEVISWKAKDLRRWHCDTVDERWLLITSPATTTHNSMHSHPDRIDWGDVSLQKECKASGFDRIFFWSRKPHAWCQSIWPMSSVIRVAPRR